MLIFVTTIYLFPVVISLCYLFQSNKGYLPITSNTKGSLLMAFAMAGFAIEDMFIKAAVNTTDIGIVLSLFGLGGMVAFMLIATRLKQPWLPRQALCTPIAIRAVCEVTGRLTFALAITLGSLSNASAILQATPLIAMIGASWLFKEQIGLGRWVAVMVGFVGILMILRPGLEGFQWHSIFAVIATLGFAGRDLATRAAPTTLSNIQLGIYGFAVLIPTGLVLFATNDVPAAFSIQSNLQILGSIICGVFAYNALTIAMRIGEVSVVSPFRYTRLLFALVLGSIIFNESLDQLTLLGSALVVVSGGYTLISSRKHHR